MYIAIHTLLSKIMYVYICIVSFLLYVEYPMLQPYYNKLVRNMPDDYMRTVGQLERHLTGDHIGSILECKDVFTANQKILDCLIEQINNDNDFYGFCDKLCEISNAALSAVVKNVRKGILFMYIISIALH